MIEINARYKIAFVFAAVLIGAVIFSKIALSQVVDPSASYKFSTRTAAAITSNVGKPVYFRVDVGNIGKSEDSYIVSITSSNPNTVNIVPHQVTTGTVAPDDIAFTEFSITSLVDIDSQITVTVSSVNCATCEIESVNIPVTSGLFSLPEYGIEGFLTIMMAVGVIYFLITNKMIKT
ncbi:MAG: hypothetical protein HYW22_00705 [Candidatus Aenigmarchaeota archaeon]|nr:hypothetical protein [Candidatus Aenigmarchaeota archaeon]